ncbi:MAG: inositol monophosphatase family protein [Sulfurospirillum sp.]
MGKTKAPEGKTDTWQSANRKILELANASPANFSVHILPSLCFSKIGVFSRWSNKMIDKLIDIVKEAGVIFKKGYNNKKSIEFKGKKDLVTQYDKGIEKFLIDKLSSSFEEYNIIAEESDNSKIEFGNSIIIDPIDGTTNFVNKIPHCAISIGVYKNKKAYIGIVYNPILNELYTAIAGNGSYLNGKLLEVSNDANFQTSLISTGFPYTSASNRDDLNWVIKKLKMILPKCQDIRRLGSASIDLCMVANGIYEGYYEINLKSWDVSAGILILEEAGGKVTNSYNLPYDMFNDRCIVATNGKIHEELLSYIEN